MSDISASSLSKSRPRPLKAERETNNYFTLLETILRQIQDRIGTDNGDVNGLIFDTVNSAVMQLVQSTYQQLLAPPIEITTSSNVTTYGSSLIIVTGVCTINLNAYPDHLEQVLVVVSTDDEVSVTDGVGTDILRRNEIVMSYRFFNNQGWIRGA